MLGLLVGSTILSSCDKDDSLPNGPETVQFAIRVPESFRSGLQNAWVVTHNQNGDLIDYKKVSSFPSVFVNVEKGKSFNLTLIKVPDNDDPIDIKTITNMSIMSDFFLELKSENQNEEKVANGSFQITLQHYARMINFIISNGELNAPRFSSMIGYTVYSDVTSFPAEFDAII